jgi:hypothetical protein
MIRELAEGRIYVTIPNPHQKNYSAFSSGFRAGVTR